MIWLRWEATAPEAGAGAWAGWWCGNGAVGSGCVGRGVRGGLVRCGRMHGTSPPEAGRKWCVRVWCDRVDGEACRPSLSAGYRDAVGLCDVLGTRERDDLPCKTSIRVRSLYDDTPVPASRRRDSDGWIWVICAARATRMVADSVCLIGLSSCEQFVMLGRQGH